MMAAPKRLDLSKCRVFLVDDNNHSLDVLTQIFLGFRVEQIMSARSATEATEHLSTRTFDLILIDCEMPSEDGIRLTERLRKETRGPNPTAPVILISSHTPLDRVVKARDAGANLIVKKPVSPAVLLRRIEWLARNPRDFVTTPTYCGPDRRVRNLPLPEGMSERRAEAVAMLSNPDRALSQNEVDSLFG